MNKYLESFKENCKLIEEDNSVWSDINNKVQRLTNTITKLPTKGDGKLDPSNITFRDIGERPLYHIIYEGKNNIYMLYSDDHFHVYDDDHKYQTTFSDVDTFVDSDSAYAFGAHILEDGLEKYQNEEMENDIELNNLNIGNLRVIESKVLPPDEDWVNTEDYEKFLNTPIANYDIGILETVDVLN